jgi:hypothetical protein
MNNKAIISAKKVVIMVFLYLVMVLGVISIAGLVNI